VSHGGDQQRGRVLPVRIRVGEQGSVERSATDDVRRVQDQQIAAVDGTDQSIPVDALEGVRHRRSAHHPRDAGGQPAQHLGEVLGRQRGQITAVEEDDRGHIGRDLRQTRQRRIGHCDRHEAVEPLRQQWPPPP
jgi:hypothetical protein